MTIGDDEIWALEERFWLDGEPAYREHMITSAVMLFPEPAGIMEGEAILASLAQAPRWSHVDLSEGILVRPNDRMAIAAYRAHARRDEDSYRAICASSYALVEGEWKLVHHQQTPAGET